MFNLAGRMATVTVHIVCAELIGETRISSARAAADNEDDDQDIREAGLLALGLLLNVWCWV